MSNLYDTIKATFDAGPDYAKRSDFTSVFGYSKGTALGRFPDKAAATAAGATSTEPYFDKAGYAAADGAYRAHQTKISTAWHDALRAEYPGVNDAVFALIYGKAWEDGHSYGHNEVEIHLSDLYDLATKIIDASK